MRSAQMHLQADIAVNHIAKDIKAPFVVISEYFAPPLTHFRQQVKTVLYGQNTVLWILQRNESWPTAIG